MEQNPPFPRIVLKLRCHPAQHELFFSTNHGIPSPIWTGPRELICLKRGKSGKKFLFNNSMAGERSNGLPGSLLQAALTSLEPARRSILPHSCGIPWPESASITVILPFDRDCHCLWFDPHLLAQTASFGFSLDIDLSIAIPLTETERAENRMIYQELGVPDPSEIAQDDW